MPWHVVAMMIPVGVFVLYHCLKKLCSGRVSVQWENGKITNFNIINEIRS